MADPIDLKSARAAIVLACKNETGFGDGVFGEDDSDLRYLALQSAVECSKGAPAGDVLATAKQFLKFLGGSDD